mmetsp:Transcript_87326/g.245122  ORF Transcript_87326/g.245122 Transcript_87326/m.245122 type:complete len:290 (-) Transcript_87326:754-1623(-)
MHAVAVSFEPVPSYAFEHHDVAMLLCSGCVGGLCSDGGDLTTYLDTPATPIAHVRCRHQSNLATLKGNQPFAFPLGDQLHDCAVRQHLAASVDDELSLDHIRFTVHVNPTVLIDAEELLVAGIDLDGFTQNWRAVRGFVRRHDEHLLIRVFPLVRKRSLAIRVDAQHLAIQGLQPNNLPALQMCPRACLYGYELPHRISLQRRARGLEYTCFPIGVQVTAFEPRPQCHRRVHLHARAHRPDFREFDFSDVIKDRRRGEKASSTRFLDDNFGYLNHFFCHTNGFLDPCLG